MEKWLIWQDENWDLYLDSSQAQDTSNVEFGKQSEDWQ